MMCPACSSASGCLGVYARGRKLCVPPAPAPPLLSIHIRNEMRHAISDTSESLPLAVPRVDPTNHLQKAPLAHISQTQTRSKAAWCRSGGPVHHLSHGGMHVCPGIAHGLPCLPQSVGATRYMLARVTQCQHARPRCVPAVEHYLTNSLPLVSFWSSDLTHILPIPFLDDVHTRGRPCFTVLDTESHCVMRNNFFGHLRIPFVCPQQRTTDATWRRPRQPFA